MGIVVNIRGANGSGKTTVSRSWINHYKLSEKTIETKYGKAIIQISDDCKKIAIGKYRNICGGCDTIKSTKAVRRIILEVIKMFSPDVIVFEGIIISGLISFTYNTAKSLESYGYEYKGVLLDKGLENSLKDIFERNCGKRINEKFMIDKYNSCYRCYIKLKKLGLKLRIVNPYKYGKDNLFSIVDEEIYSK